MRIVFIAYLHGFGGAERQIVMLANAMLERGHEVYLLSISADNRCYEINNKINYRYIPDRKSNFLRVFTRYSDLKRELKIIRPDLTINFWYQSAYLTALMKKTYTGRIIYSERGDPGDKEYSGVLGMIRALTLHRIDGFVFQSKAAKKYFNSKIQKRSVVISNPVFIKSDILPKDISRRKAIVTVGRLCPQKNQILLLDAFASISNEIPDYILEIYGEGEWEEKLKKRIRNLNLSHRVLLMGTSSRIHDLILNASLFVLSSDYEGIPNTLLEAMALGIPCITTDCRPGGAREIIDNGKDGIIVPVGGQKELANAIRNCITNMQASLNRAQIAQKKMIKFNPNIIYKKWERFFLKICKVLETE